MKNRSATAAAVHDECARLVRERNAESLRRNFRSLQTPTPTGHEAAPRVDASSTPPTSSIRPTKGNVTAVLTAPGVAMRYAPPKLRARWEKLEAYGPTFKATRSFFDAFGADEESQIHERTVLHTVASGIVNSIAAAAKRLGMRLTNVNADVFGADATKVERDIHILLAEREKTMLQLAEKQHEVDEAERERDLYRAEVARLQENVGRLQELLKKREQIDTERAAAFFGMSLDEVTA